MIFIAITWPVRKLLYSAVVAGAMTVAALVTTFLTAGVPEGAIAVGAPPSVISYLEEYRDLFCSAHPQVDIRFVPIGTPQEVQRPDGLDFTLIPQGSSWVPSGTEMDTLEFRFVPVVSPFNPTKELALSQLQGIYSGNLRDWSEVAADWSGSIETVTCGNNPANDLAAITLPLSSERELTSRSGVLEHLFRNPQAIAVMPLAWVQNVNLVRLTGVPGDASGFLTVPVFVREQRFGMVPQGVLNWLRRFSVKRRILNKFADFIRTRDDLRECSDALNLKAVGDIMLDRRVGQAVKKHGARYPFEAVQSELQRADIAFANLETPISDRGWLLNMFRADPKVVEGLTAAGLDVVSIANNHILDFDDPALFDTIALLEKHGIRTVGAGRNLAAAREPAIINVGDTAVAFLAYTELWFCHTKSHRRYDATPYNTGVAPAIEEYVLHDVMEAAEDAEYVVVSFHWGKEYSHSPTAVQKQMARLAIDAGADLVLGHHPHVLQGIDFYKDGVIIYSLGNFVFDQNYAGTQDTVIASVTFSNGRIVRLDLLPGRIINYQPRLLSGEDKERFLRTLWRYSMEAGENTFGNTTPMTVEVDE